MHDPAFQASVSAIEASLRAATLAAETGDAARVGAELVRSSLTIGVQMGAYKTRLGASFELSPVGRTLNRLLVTLQGVAVQAFARAEEIHDIQRARFHMSDAAERQERQERHTTYADANTPDEYLP